MLISNIRVHSFNKGCFFLCQGKEINVKLKGQIIASAYEVRRNGCRKTSILNKILKVTSKHE